MIKELYGSSLGYTEYRKEGFTFFNEVNGNVALDTQDTNSDFGNYQYTGNILNNNHVYDFNPNDFQYNEQKLDINSQIEEDANRLNESQNNLAISSLMAGATMIVFAIVLHQKNI